MGPWEGSQISESGVPTSEHLKAACLVPAPPRPKDIPLSHKAVLDPHSHVPAIYTPFTTRLPACGPGGAPSTGPRPASSTPRTHGSLRHTAGIGELRRQRPVLSLSSSLRSMPPQQQPKAAEDNFAGAGPSARFPQVQWPLSMPTNRRAGPASDAPVGVVVDARDAVAAAVLSSGNCSPRELPPRARFVVGGGRGHFASSASLLLEPGSQ